MYKLRGVRVGRHRSPSQESSRATTDLLDSMQEDLEDTQIRRKTRRRVVPSDEDFPPTQPVPVVDHNRVASRRVVFLLASSDIPRSALERISERDSGDEAARPGGPQEAPATVPVASRTVRAVNEAISDGEDPV